MEKLRFTQIFRESGRELSDDEKLKIILSANPDKEEEIRDEYEDADFNGKLESFFNEYKDVLDSANVDSTETDAIESSNDVEVNDSEDTINDTTTDSENNDVQDEEELENSMSDEQLEKKVQNDAKAASVSNGKSKLVFDSELYKKVLDTLLGDNQGKRSELEKHFEEYEEFFGFTPSGKKPEVKVMFRTPEDWPVKTGDYVKKDDPLFDSVACMNEFALWMIGAEIWSQTKEISDLLKPVFENDKIAGTELNRYIKSQCERIANQQGAARLACINGTSEINDPLELSEDGSRKVHNDLLIFMYLKIVPTIFRCIKTGGAYHTATARISDPNSLYGQLYRIAHDGGVGGLKGEDEFTDIVYDSFAAFLGGRIALRAPYENVLLSHPEIDKSNADVLCIFDTGFIDNEYTKSRNIFKKMADEFTARNPEFRIQNTRKAYGKGAIKTLGNTQTASGAAARGETDEIIQNKLDLGEYSEEDVNNIMKARKDITTENIRLEPFAVIANKLSSIFSNFASAMTRAGAKMRDVSNVYGRRFFSDEDIENAPEVLPPNRKKGEFTKSEMIASNEEWKKALAKIKNFNPMSLSTPTTGKDGDVGSIGDTIAAPSEEAQRELKDDLPDEFNNIIRSVNLVKSKADKDLKSNEDDNLIGRDLFSLLKLEQFLFAGFNWLGYTPVNAWNFTGGYQEDRPEKALLKIKDWCRLALVGKYSTIGGDTDPHFGLGNTDIRDTKHNTLLDSLAKVRGRGGVWFMEKTPEGLEERKKILNFLEKDYEDNFEKLYDFVKTNTKFDSVKTFIDSLGLSKTTWEPSSIIPEDIRTPANLVYQYDKNGNPKVMLKNQDAKKVSNWVRTIFADNPNSKTFDPLVNPKNKNFDANMPIVDKIRDVTGIDLYSYFKDGKVDNKGILAALKAWSNLTHNEFNVFTGTEDNLASLSDEKSLQGSNFFKSGSSIIQTNHVNPKDKPSFDKHILTTTTSPELIRRGAGVTYRDSLELENFFKDVFREASTKEIPKKQRFTIN